MGNLQSWDICFRNGKVLTLNLPVRINLCGLFSTTCTVASEGAFFSLGDELENDLALIRVADISYIVKKHKEYVS